MGSLWTVRLDPVGGALVVAAAVGLVVLVRRAAARDRRTPPLRIALLATGVAIVAAATLAFPGADAVGLRLAFVVKVALLVVVAPTVVAAGRPVALLRDASGARGEARIDRVMRSRVVRLLGNGAVAPLVPLAALAVLLTPLAGPLRTAAPGEWAVDLLGPAAGLAVAVPVAEPAIAVTTLGVTAAFLIGFVELVADAIPGILMRLAATVLDGVRHAAIAPGWHLSPLRDQQLAGDLLWCLAEAADIPALLLLLVQWIRSDRRDADAADRLTDEEFAAAAAEHLRRR